MVGIGRRADVCAICDDDRGETVICREFVYDGWRYEGSCLVVVVVSARKSDYCAFETVCSSLGWRLDFHVCFSAVQVSPRPYDGFREVTWTCLCVFLVACNPLVNLSSLDLVMARAKPDAASSATSLRCRTLHLAFALCKGLVTVTEHRVHHLLRNRLTLSSHYRRIVGLELYCDLRGLLDTVKVTSEGGIPSMMTHLL